MSAKTEPVVALSSASGTLSDRLKRRVEEDILAGRLLPGERLDERELAQRYGVSRTPVREALVQLSASGLIDIRPRQGAVVATMSIPHLLHMFEVLVLLEAQCAKLAARRMTAEERQRLQELHEHAGRELETGGAAAVESFTELNWRFHQQIFAGSHNPFLYEQARALRLRVAPWRRYLLSVMQRTAISQREHGEIVAAITQGDGEAAFRHMQTHLCLDGDKLADFLAVLPNAMREDRS